MRASNALVLVGAMALAGCAESGPYLYTPTSHATATLPETGAPVAEYPVPPSAPRGTVRIASLGVDRLRGGEAPGKHLVLRFVVTNNGDVPWSFDAGRQLVILPDGRQLAPDLVYGQERATSSVRTVPPREQRAFDLLYPVGEATPTFQVAWAVGVGPEMVSDRTDFRRVEMAPAYTYDVAYGDWYYPPGWYWPGPYAAWDYPRAWFGPSVTVAPGLARAPVHVAPPPPAVTPVAPPPAVAPVAPPRH